MLSSTEIGTLITAIGAGVGNTELDISKSRYHKIIIMTDADVDGSHIRTLLLTFFFRHMRPLVDAGYLYIAQPPLFKLKIGKSEVYLKDQDKLDNFLIENGIKDCSLKISNGETVLDKDLRAIIDTCIVFNKYIKSLDRKIGNGNIIRYLSILGCLSEDLLTDTSMLEKVNSFFTKKLSFQGNIWDISVNKKNNEILFIKKFRGIEDKFKFKSTDFTNHEVIELNKMYEKLNFFENKTKLIFETNETEIFSPDELVNFIMDRGKKGTQISRYKGLGEMNPDQLWETTLDPNSRNLVQVNVDQESQAEETFSTLMGEIVEHRRNFIQENALNVSNLDV